MSKHKEFKLTPEQIADRRETWSEAERLLTIYTNAELADIWESILISGMASRLRRPPGREPEKKPEKKRVRKAAGDKKKPDQGLLWL
jgi:hypothetical protein